MKTVKEKLGKSRQHQEETESDDFDIEAAISNSLKGCDIVLQEPHEIIEAVIERLKKERDDKYKELFEDGKMEGKGFFEFASYEELQCAVTLKPTGNFDRDGFNPELGPWNVWPLSNYFEEMISLYVLWDGEYWAHWEAGWMEGVKEFWNHHKDKFENSNVNYNLKN